MCGAGKPGQWNWWTGGSRHGQGQGARVKHKQLQIPVIKLSHMPQPHGDPHGSVGTVIYDVFVYQPSHTATPTGTTGEKCRTRSVGLSITTWQINMMASMMGSSSSSSMLRLLCSKRTGIPRVRVSRCRRIAPTSRLNPFPVPGIRRRLRGTRGPSRPSSLMDAKCSPWVPGNAQ